MFFKTIIFLLWDLIQDHTLHVVSFNLEQFLSLSLSLMILMFFKDFRPLVL